MLCPSCDTRNDEDARFCRVCGMSLVNSAPQPAASPPATSQTIYTYTNAPMTGLACPTCTRANPAGARYCVYCASVLAQPNPMPFAQPVMQPAMASSSANVVVNYGQPQPVQFVITNGGNLLLRAVWFFLIGWWLGLFWTIAAWLFNLTLIGLPVGLMMLNATPQVMTLRPRSKMRVQVAPTGQVMVQRPAEHPLALRAIWFVLIGWWASLIWMIMAWAFSASILLMPISFWMFDRVPTITTLAAE